MSRSKSTQLLAAGAVVAMLGLGYYLYKRSKGKDKKRVVFVLGGPGSGYECRYVTGVAQSE